MKENSFEKSKYGLFIVLSCFFFARTALLSPMQCLMMNSDYPYFRFSVEGLAFIILLAIFSVLSAKLAFVFQKKAGDVAAVIYIIGVSDPLFFGTQDNVLKLIANIAIQLLIFNTISEKKIIPTGIAFPVVLFVSAFLVPNSIFGYVPVMISIFVLACSISGKEKKYIIWAFTGAFCAAAGYLINKILVSRVPVFSELLSRFGFVEFTGPNKHISIAMALIPVAVFTFLFLRQYYKNTGKTFSKKKSLREQHIQRLIDAFIYPLIISLIAIFFTDAAGFCAINLFLPAIILTLICVEDEVCKKTVDDILCFIKEHKIISASVFVAVFAFAFKGMINYHSLKQLVFYLRY